MTIKSIIFGVYIVCIAITLNAANRSVSLWSNNKVPNTKFIWVAKHDAPLVKEAYKEKSAKILVKRISRLTRHVYDLKIQLERERQYSSLLSSQISLNTASDSSIAQLTQQVNDLKKELKLANEFKSLVLSEVISIESNSLGASSMQSSILVPDDLAGPNDQEYSQALEGSFTSSDDENPGESSNGAEK